MSNVIQQPQRREALVLRVVISGQSMRAAPLGVNGNEVSKRPRDERRAPGTAR